MSGTYAPKKNFCMILGKNFLVVFEELNKIALHKAPSMFYILNTTCFLNVRNIYLSCLNKRDSVGIGLNSDNGRKQGSKPLNRAFGPVQSFEINSLNDCTFLIGIIDPLHLHLKLKLASKNVANRCFTYIL